MNNTQLQIMQDIAEERLRQDQKWGVQNHDHFTWLGILMEEVGESSKAALEHRFGHAPARLYREELVQVAAVAVAMLECYDRHHDAEGQVYLAGPIKGCAPDEIFSWRSYAASHLIYRTLDPASERNFAHKESTDPMREIVDPDKRDIDASQIVLANCWKESVGTSMEVLYAWEHGKLVVVVIPEGQTVSAWIIAHSHKIYRDLGEAINYINEM